MIALPTPEEIITIHTAVIKRTGGSDGLRDAGALELASKKAQAIFGGVEMYPDIFTKAAATLESIARNHPFFDGNKRTSFMTALRIIESNGYTASFDNKDIEDTIVRVVTEKLSIEVITEWLKSNSTKM
jgi:death-on-curing protein